MEEKTELEKLTIILSHWISHNQSHIKEMKKWQLVAENEAPQEVTLEIQRAVEYMESTDTALQKALDGLGGSQGHHHHHH